MSSFKVKGQFMATFMMFDLEIHREFKIIFEINTWPVMFRLVRVRFFRLWICPIVFVEGGFNHHDTDWSKKDRPEDDRLP